ncbi:MAG: DUF1800 family protein [Hyphomonadaceae bacterium]
MSGLQGAIAATRFGMGAAPGDISAAASDPRGWLKAQVRPDSAILPGGQLLSARQILQARQRLRASNNEADMRREVAQRANQDGIEHMRDEVIARIRQASETPNSFAERWVRFWANHFTVAVRTPVLAGLAGPFEREAIRPHVFGTFANLLRQATFHQGMLIYLDAAESIGPSTVIGRRKDKGLNENLAREILELHTLGVGAGYAQADVIALANALTGWTVGGLQPAITRATRASYRRRNKAQPQARDDDDMAGQVVFVDALHEPGPRIVLGKQYQEGGREQAPAILQDLARHTATARHIATKLARHFVADHPPASAVTKLSDVFVRTGGNLADLARAVIDLDEAWLPEQQKFKTPEELVVSIARIAPGQPRYAGAIGKVYASLTQLPFRAPSPAGWPDDAASWAGPDAVKKRLDWVNAISRGMARGASPGEMLDTALGELASSRTRQFVEHAESAEQGFTLALMAPEFQRR